ncbi:MAG: LysM peptidoglycan-binding domain-containing protein [Acidiferrobacterales bacterium]
MKKFNLAWKVLLMGVVLAVASGCATTKEEIAGVEAPDAQPKKKEAPELMPAQPGEMAPAEEVKEQEEVMVVEEEGLTQYTVVRGDNLWDIASYRVIYGNPYQWPLIYRANQDQIADADLIEPGQVLVIPRDSSASQIEMAIQHARSRGAWQLGVVEQSDREYLQRSM